MTKDELWEKYSQDGGVGEIVDKSDFLAALTEYGEHVRAEAVKVCEEYPKRDPAEDGNGYWAANECAAAIEKMPLP